MAIRIVVCIWQIFLAIGNPVLLRIKNNWKDIDEHTETVSGLISIFKQE